MRKAAGGRIEAVRDGWAMFGFVNYAGIDSVKDQNSGIVFFTFCKDHLDCSVGNW